MVFERFPGRRHRRPRRTIAVGSSLLILAGLTTAAAGAATHNPNDPRASLSARFLEIHARGRGARACAHRH